MKYYTYKFLLAAAFGWVASFLQELVLTGRWSSWDIFIGEWVYTTLYFFVLWFLILFILRRLPPILPKGALKLNHIVWGLLIAVLVGVVWEFALAIIMEIIVVGSWDFTFKASDQLRFIMLYYVMLIGLNYAVMCAYKIGKQFTLVRNAGLRSEKAAMEAQLQMLRSQLNPHFLFNSLNIIASTVKSDPDVAYDFTKNMAAFYRKVLESENVGWVLLKEELKTIRYYLKMLSIRFEDKLVIDIKVKTDEEEQYLVPEFILQPIVENIIKHNECSRQKPLHIHIEVVDNGTLVIKNNMQVKNVKQDSLGIGWLNIESRYKYLGAGTPEKFESEGWFHVRIPLAQSNIS